MASTVRPGTNGAGPWTRAVGPGVSTGRASCPACRPGWRVGVGWFTGRAAPLLPVTTCQWAGRTRGPRQPTCVPGGGVADRGTVRNRDNTLVAWTGSRPGTLFGLVPGGPRPQKVSTLRSWKKVSTLRGNEGSDDLACRPAGTPTHRHLGDQSPCVAPRTRRRRCARNMRGHGMRGQFCRTHSRRDPRRHGKRATVKVGSVREHARQNVTVSTPCQTPCQTFSRGFRRQYRRPIRSAPSQLTVGDHHRRERASDQRGCTD